MVAGILAETYSTNWCLNTHKQSRGQLGAYYSFFYEFTTWYKNNSLPFLSVFWNSVLAKNKNMFLLHI